MRWLPILCSLGLMRPSMAQTALPAGIVLHNDSSLLSVFGFRMQNRADFHHLAGAGQRSDELNFQVRRFRLKLDGHAISPRLEYKVQLGLSNRDMEIGDGSLDDNPILDAMVFYKLGTNTRLGLGQGKQPGGRQAIISSGALELPERPLANSAFVEDRDRGLTLVQLIPWGKQVLHALGAVSQGEGRAMFRDNKGLCFTGRMEWLPLGEFRDGGEYREGDLDREPNPKLAVAVAYSSNRNAQRARAQSGPRLPDGQSRTIGTFFADAVFKHMGWAWQTDLDRRLAAGSPLVPDTASQLITAVNEGWGLTNQLSRMVGKHSQLIARHSMVRLDPDASPYYKDRDEAMLGYTHYISGHRIKLQSAVFYDWGNGVFDLEHPGNQYGLILQVEMGI